MAPLQKPPKYSTGNFAEENTGTCTNSEIFSEICKHIKYLFLIKDQAFTVYGAEMTVLLLLTFKRRLNCNKLGKIKNSP